MPEPTVEEVNTWSSERKAKYWAKVTESLSGRVPDDIQQAIADRDKRGFCGPVNKPAPVLFRSFLDPFLPLPPLKFGDYAGSFSYLGPHDCTLARRAADYCANVAKVDGGLMRLFMAFFDHLESEHLESHHTSLWLSIRVTQPGRIFDVPHWHHDGRYFTPIDGHEPAFKVGAVLSGPPTLFLSSIGHAGSQIPSTCPLRARKHPARKDAHNCWFRPAEKLTEFIRSESLVSKWNETEQVKDLIRSGMREGMTGYKKRQEEWFSWHWRKARLRIEKQLHTMHVSHAGPGETARWLVGDGHRDAVHTEPPFTAPRLVITVLPATETQIRELCDRWGNSFGQEYHRVVKTDRDVEALHQQISLTNTPWHWYD